MNDANFSRDLTGLTPDFYAAIDSANRWNADYDELQKRMGNPGGNAPGGNKPATSGFLKGSTMWPTFGDQYSGGGYGNYFGAGFNAFGQGMNAMSNLGNTIGGGFALANAQSGQNLANNYAMNAASFGPQAAMYAEAQKTARLNAVIPALLAAFSRGGSGGSGMTGFTTNYGAGGHI